MITNRYISHYLNQKSKEVQFKPNINNDTKIISLKSKNKNQEPPKHKEKKSENCLTNIDQLKGKSKTKKKQKNKRRVNFIVNSNENSQKKIKYTKANNLTQNIVISNKKNFNGETSRTTINKLIPQLKDKESVENNILFPNVKDMDFNIEEYLEKGYDDMEYDEAIRKDNRKFCDCYYEKLKDNQIIVNIFCSNEPIRPKSIKIIFLILQVNLYFFINGLFYDEDYISNIYHLDKDTFSTMAERFFDNLIYAALAGIVINFIIEFFFIEEKKIKIILRLEKDNILMLKNEMLKILKNIKTRYLIFIIISLLITSITFVHSLCFNIVYKHTKLEWIVFSFIIILSMQVGSFLLYLAQTALRLISLKVKSEKLFKLSL